MFDFQSIFSSKPVSKLVDGLYNGIDKLNFTDEEKVNTHLKFLKLYEPFKLAQRYIAFFFSINFIVSFWIGVFILFFRSKEQLNDYINLIIAFNFGWIMTTIIGFYFAGGLFNKKDSNK